MVSYREEIIEKIVSKQLPLSNIELNFIDDVISASKRFVSYDSIPYILRQDWLNDNLYDEERACKNISVESSHWRDVLENECELSISRLCHFYGYINTSNFGAVVMWRGALAYTRALSKYNIKMFNIRVRRDEKTLEVITIMPLNYNDRLLIKNNQYTEYIIPDVMLATGNSSATAIDLLEGLGVNEEHITVLCVVSAPEGVFRLLEQYPMIHIVANTLDRQLNENGYIIGDGLGDAGDKYFYQNTIESFIPYHTMFSDDQWEYLQKILIDANIEEI